METKLIALVLAGLIGGLAGGYGLGYVIIQPQIHNLQSDLEHLNSIFETLDTDFANLNTSVESSVNSLEDELGNVESSVNSLEDELGTLGSDVTSLEDGLDALDDSVTSLDSTIDTMESRTWHEVYTVAASSDSVSGIFNLKGKEVKISWLALSDYTSAWIEIDLCFSNGTVYSYWGSSGIFAIMDNEIHLSQAGNYYLVIYTYLTDYAVRLYDYY